MKELDRRQFDGLRVEKVPMDDGRFYEVYIPEKYKYRIPFENYHCSFTPIGWIRTDHDWLPLVYKVVTDDMKSLGLRKNPTIFEYKLGEWSYETRNLQYGDEDYGGIWSAHRRGSVNTIKKHCLETWGMKTRGFLTAAYNPIAFVGNYRVKSEGVMLLKEIS